MPGTTGWIKKLMSPNARSSVKTAVRPILSCIVRHLSLKEADTAKSWFPICVASSESWKIKANVTLGKVRYIVRGILRNRFVTGRLMFFHMILLLRLPDPSCELPRDFATATSPTGGFFPEFHLQPRLNGASQH